MKPLYIALSILILATSSCKKEDSLSLGPGPSGNRLKSITYQTEGRTWLSMRFSYNASGNVSSCRREYFQPDTSVRGPIQGFTHMYYYDTDGRMRYEVSDQQSIGDTIWYSYDDMGRIKKYEVINDSGHTVTSYNFKYNGTESLDLEYFHRSDNTHTTYYLDLDSKGNVTDMSYQSGASPATTVFSDARYDDLYNVLSYIKGMPFYYSLFIGGLETMSFNNMTQYRAQSWYGLRGFEYKFVLDKSGKIVERYYSTDTGDVSELYEYERY